MLIMLWIQLVAMLIVIFLAAQIFTNAIEHFGAKIKISEGVTGSIFSAVATALPETIVPVLAILAGSPNRVVNEEISVGAILGAPLMLATLSTAMMAISAIGKRGLRGRIRPEKAGFVRDLNFFLIAFTLAAVAMYVPVELIYVRGGISFVLVALYVLYIVMTLKASRKLVDIGHGTVTDGSLFITKFNLSNHMVAILLQITIGLVLLLVGAKGFINALEHISVTLNISALLISLLIIPIATELPEKVNSIIWVRKNKDTLGFGNITGAMVFQGTLLPALGILLTPWQPSKVIMTGIFMTLIAAAWLRLNAKDNGLTIIALLINGIFYLLYLYLVIGI